MSLLKKMPVSTGEITAAAADLQADSIELRRAIHRDPELGLELPRTQERILESLTGLDLDITRGITSTSVVADLDSGRPGPTVLLRGDMDALPMTEEVESDFRSEHEERSHACGHDAHVAMLVGAARFLSANRSEFRGRIRFMFQPGEEGFHGAKHMIDEGVLDGVDRAFAIHVFMNMPAGLVGVRSGPAMASADKFEITVNGKGGHASAPHHCADPIPAAAGIVTGLHTMVGRSIDAHDPAVVTVANLNAGTTNNVIPPSAYMQGTIRTFDERVRDEIHTNINRVADGISAAHGCTCETVITRGYPVTINDAEQATLTAEVATQLLGAENYFSMKAPVMGAEDFSYVLQHVPGTMAFLGACPVDIADPRTAAPNHSNKMRLNEDVMTSGVALYSAMALAQTD